MSSLTSPALTLAAQKAIIASKKYLAKAREFATDFSADSVAPMTTLKIAVYNGGVANNFKVASDASNNDYETTDGTVTFASVTFDNQPKSTFSFTEKDFTEYNNSSVWSNAGRAAGEAVGKAIIKKISSYVNPDQIAAETVMDSVTKAKFAKLRKACATAGIDPSKAVVLLEPSTFADVLALLDFEVYGSTDAIKNGVIPGLYGFKSVIEANDLDTATYDNLIGAIIPEDALVIAAKALPIDAAAYTEVGYEQDPDSGLVMSFRRHTVARTGYSYATVEALFGVTLAQPAATLRIVSEATPTPSN